MFRVTNRGSRENQRYNPYPQNQSQWGSFVIPKQSPIPKKSLTEQLKELEEKKRKLLKEIAIENNVGRRIKEVNNFLKTNPNNTEMRKFLIKISSTTKKEIHSLYPTNHWTRFHSTYPNSGTTTFEPCVKFNSGQCHSNEAAHITGNTKVTILHHSCWICYKVAKICTHEKVSQCELLKYLDRKEKEAKEKQKNNNSKTKEADTKSLTETPNQK